MPPVQVVNNVFLLSNTSRVIQELTGGPFDIQATRYFPPPLKKFKNEEVKSACQ